MTTRSRAALALAVGLGLALAAPPRAPLAAAAEATLTARPEVGRPVEQAEALLRQKKLKAALAELAKADAVPKKTPYEVYVIAATRAVVLNDSADYAGAITALEAALATGVLPPAEAMARRETLVELAYRSKDYPRVVAFGEAYYRAGGTDEAPRRLMAQAYYLENDFAAAARTSRAALQAETQAGRPPAEALLQLLASSEYRRQHGGAYRDALAELVATYPKREYWRELLAAMAAEPSISGPHALDLARLKAATGTMASADDYMEAAQRALLAGLPGDAKAFLDLGFANGTLGQGADAGRQQRLAAMANRQSSEDLARLPAEAKAAEAARDGATWVKLGEAYASHGQYRAAVAAFEKGLEIGVKDPAEAKLDLGIARLKADRPAQGQAVLRGIAGEGAVGDLARLWLLAEKVPAQTTK
jgi:hypothetical protein